MNKLSRTKPYLPKEDHKEILDRIADILNTESLVQSKYVSEFENMFCGSIVVQNMQLQLVPGGTCWESKH
jgi:hypothetical protein